MRKPLAFPLVAILSLASVVFFTRAATPASDSSWQGLVGTWRMDSTELEQDRTAIGPNLPALLTFSSDGTLVGSIGLPAGLPHPSAFQGVWIASGALTASLTWDVLTFNEQINGIARVTLSSDLTLSDDGQSFRGQSEYDVLDLTGGVIDHGYGTIEASRMTVETFGSPVASPAVSVATP